MSQCSTYIHLDLFRFHPSFLSFCSSGHIFAIENPLKHAVSPKILFTFLFLPVFAKTLKGPFPYLRRKALVSNKVFHAVTIAYVRFLDLKTLILLNVVSFFFVFYVVPTLKKVLWRLSSFTGG